METSGARPGLRDVMSEVTWPLWIAAAGWQEGDDDDDDDGDYVWEGPPWLPS